MPFCAYWGLLPGVQFQALVKHFGQHPIRGQVDTWPRTGAGVKNGDGWPGAAGAGGGELPPKGVFDHSAQRLTTLAGSAFGGSQ